MFQFNPLLPVTLLSYLENQLSCSWCEYPSTLVPGLLTTARPLLVLPHFHTPQIKLQYLHRRHQQYQPSSSDTKNRFGLFECPVVHSISARQSACRGPCKGKAKSTAKPAPTANQLLADPWFHKRVRSMDGWCIFLCVPHVFNNRHFVTLDVS